MRHTLPITLTLLLGEPINLSGISAGVGMGF
jgi:hypothetical protein